MRLRAAWTVGLALAAFSGCVHHEASVPEPTWTRGAATNGYLLLDSAVYDSNGVLQFDDSFARVTVDTANHSGTVAAHGRIDGRPWSISMDNFSAPTADHWAGRGIATDVALWGSSGHGGPELPTSHATLAGWGRANLTIEASEDDALTTPWDATFAFLKDGIRNDDRRAIFNDSTKRTFYNPARPDQVLYERGHGELHLRLTSSLLNRDPPKLFDFDGPAPRMTPYPVTDQQSFYFNNSLVPARLNLTIVVKGTPAGYGYYEFSLRAPGKQTVGFWTYSFQNKRPVGVPAAVAATLPIQNLTLHQRGMYTLHVYAYGDVDATYHIHGLMSGLEPVANFWFDDVAWGDDALRLLERDPNP